MGHPNLKSSFACCHPRTDLSFSAELCIWSNLRRRRRRRTVFVVVILVGLLTEAFVVQQLSKRRFKEKARLAASTVCSMARVRTGPLVAPEPFAHQGQKIEWISVSSNALPYRKRNPTIPVSNSIDRIDRYQTSFWILQCYILVLHRRSNKKVKAVWNLWVIVPSISFLS